MTENRYLVNFYKNDVNTITMEKFAISEEEAINKCIEKTKILKLDHMYDRYEITELPKKQPWE